MHALLRKYLAFLARLIIKTKKPFIIGITGTAGKTTISRFIATFLSEEFWKNSVQFSQHNYNGEYGLPLAIIGAKSGWKNPLAWLSLFFITIKKICTQYPKYLILEYGIDHLGEMDFLLSIGVPDIAIVTPISPNHIEQFGDFESYRSEKLKIFRAKNIILHDSLEKFIQHNCVLYGKWKNSNFSLLESKNTEFGTIANFTFNNETFSFAIPVFWEFQAENILALFAIAQKLEIPFKHLQEITKKLSPEAGRNRIFRGIKNSIIIDGTYNGGPLSVMEGIFSVLPFLETNKIFLFLGDMRELGSLTAEKHTEIAKKIIEIFEQNSEKIKIFLVGPMTQKFMKPLLEKKFFVFHSLSSLEAGEMMKKIIENEHEQILTFAKGSQNTIFLEEGLKKILKESDHQKLCRQSADWLQKKEKFFASLL